MSKTSASEMVAALLKTIYPEGEVNAMRIWKGYDVSTGRTGWHIQEFGRSDCQYIGGSVSEVEEYVDAVADCRENI
jgi:hypothetical protein